MNVADAGSGMSDSTRHVHFADASMVAKAVDTKKKRFFFAESIDKHRGHRSLEQASAAALRKLCEEAAERLVPQLAKAATELRL